MKKMLLIGILGLGCFGSHAQSHEAQQLLLNWEKLTQLKQILSDMKKGYEIVSKGYTAIKNISEGNFSIHQVFLDGLMQVSPTVRNYKRIADIANYQVQLVQEYKSAFKRFKASDLFNAKEIDYMGNVYGNLFDLSLKNMDDLLNLITANRLRMSDDERLKEIDRIYNDMQDKLVFLRHFNGENSLLAVQRMKASVETERLQKLYK